MKRSEILLIIEQYKKTIRKNTALKK